LSEAGMEDRAAELNGLAGKLAREARDGAGRAVLIAGSLPPQGGTYKPRQVAPPAELEPLYREQAEALADYVDLFVCETMSTGREAAAAARAACATGKPVWVSWTLDETGVGRLRSGETIGEAAAALAGLPVSGLLVNCATPESVTRAVPQLAATGAPRVGGYANTLLPIDEGTEVGWHMEMRRDLDPDEYAAHAGRWLAAGANVVGGCCGTRPAHIARLRRLLDHASGV
jgi:S-methylmethionine-dependent homocysteine/selenocysteine methylase